MILFRLLYDLIGYTQSGTYTNTYEMYIVQGAICVVLLLTVVFIDMVYKFIRSIVRK